MSRALWPVLLPFASGGVRGLVLVIAAQSMLLVSTGVFNPTFTTYRMAATTDGYLSRVLAAWSISSRTAQPICIAVGGVLAGLLGTRLAMGVLALVVVASVTSLPWRAVRPAALARPAR